VVDRNDLLRWSEALSAIARTGMGFTANTFDAERYDEILRIAVDIGIAAGHEYDHDALFEEWMKGVGRGVPGYQTPKVGIGAVVVNEAEEVLLIRRADTGVWLYPTGWADVGYSPAEVAVKEVREETGIECVPERLIAVLDGLRAGFSKIPIYSLVFLCRPTGGELRHHPVECTDVGWFAQDQLPEPLAGRERWGDVFAAARGETVEALFDPPRDPVWRQPPS
jgi:ADP-ribose pyrophosphatase YjhB (NUDIX family)